MKGYNVFKLFFRVRVLIIYLFTSFILYLFTYLFTDIILNLLYPFTYESAQFPSLPCTAIRP